MRKKKKIALITGITGQDGFYLTEFLISKNYIVHGIKRKAYDENNKVIIEIDKRYFRPSEVNFLKGSSKKAKNILGWQPKKNINSLVNEMIEYELKNL